MSSGTGTVSTGMVVLIVGGFVVVTFVELDDGTAEFSELHADSSRQLTKVTTDNFFTVMYVNGPLYLRDILVVVGNQLPFLSTKTTVNLCWPLVRREMLVEVVAAFVCFTGRSST